MDYSVMPLEKRTVQRVLAYVGCILAAFIGGHAWLILIYRNYLPSQFSLSQHEVHGIFEVAVVGATFYLPLAYVGGYVGARWSMVVCCVLSGTSLFLVWESTRVRTENQPGVYILCVVFFISGLGPAMGFLTCISTSLINTSRTYMARTCAVMWSLYDLSTPVTSLFYLYGFHHGQYPSPSEDAMANFTIFLLCMIGILGMIAIPCIKVFNDFTPEDHRTANLLPCTAYTCTLSATDDVLSSTNALQWKSEHSMVKLFLTLEYQCVTWSAAIFLALAQFNKFVPFTDTTDHHYNARTFEVIYIVSAIIIRFPVSYIMDQYPERLLYYGILLVIKLLSVLSQLLKFLHVNTSITATMYAISGMVDGVCSLEIIVLMCEMFGPRQSSRNMSIPFMLKSFILVLLHLCHRTLSTRLVKSPEETFCYGSNCVFTMSVINLSLAVFGIFVFIVLIYRRLGKCSCNRKLCK